MKIKVEIPEGNYCDECIFLSNSLSICQYLKLSVQGIKENYHDVDFPLSPRERYHWLKHPQCPAKSM